MTYNEELLKSLWYQRNPCHETNSNSGEDMFWECAFLVFQDYAVEIAKHEGYKPEHDELCTVLTKEGLATQCRAYKCKGEIYAIPMKDGKPDGIFNPSQIEKFYKL